MVGPRCLPIAKVRLLLGGVLTILIVATPALAQAGFSTGVDDNILLTLPDSSERDIWFDEAVDLGAGVVRLDVFWSGVVSGQPANPTDPTDPAYDFSALDAAILDATGPTSRCS